MNRKILFVSGGGLILLAFVLAAALFQNQKTAPQNARPGQNGSVVEREGAPIKGAADARVTIVEFLDPACGTCRDFYPFLQQLIERYPGKIRVMVRYAPLHSGSDQVVRMLEAAHQQGKFWPALELLFNNQQRWVINHESQPMQALALLSSLELNQDRLKADVNSQNTARVVWQDVEDGQALGVRATPEFFVNGRPMPSFGYEQLSQLVQESMAEEY